MPHDPGVVFKLSPAPGSTWKETVLHTFCSTDNCADGHTPSGGLTMDASGNLFGVTSFGGNPQCRGDLGCGVAYKIAPSGEQSVVHAFCGQNKCADGELPTGRLIMNNIGNLYGTTVFGGTQQGGTVFRLNGGGHQVFFDFCSGCLNPTEPIDGVILDPDGNLLGTAGGGMTNAGVVYQLTP